MNFNWFHVISNYFSWVWRLLQRIRDILKCVVSVSRVGFRRGSEIIITSVEKLKHWYLDSTVEQVKTMTISFILNFLPHILYCKQSYQYIQVNVSNTGNDIFELQSKIFFSSIQTYDISCIYLYSSPSIGIFIWTHRVPAPRWLHTLVGRALHWYCKGHGFESHSGLNFSGFYFKLHA